MTPEDSPESKRARLRSFPRRRDSAEPAQLAEALGITAVALLENALPRADAT